MTPPYNEFIVRKLIDIATRYSACATLQNSSHHEFEAIKADRAFVDAIAKDVESFIAARRRRLQALADKRERDKRLRRRAA